MDSKNITCSCPSKVLILGGYAILYPGICGITLATSAKFYSGITSANYNNDTQNENHDKELNIIVNVNSIKMQKQWQYNIIHDYYSNKIEIHQKGDKLPTYQFNSTVDLQHKNTFIESSLMIAFLFVFSQNLVKKSEKIDLIIDNDREFFTVDHHPNLENQTTIRKTGLGSSSCLIVVVIGAILDHFGLQITMDRQNQELGILHILSQLSNSLAQNKIGSGFDISTCIFGSQIYTRFPAILLDDLIKVQGDIPKFKTHLEKIHYNTSFDWSACKKINLPLQLRLWMLDIFMGSDTRVFVKNVTTYLDANIKEREEFLQTTNKLSGELLKIFDNINKSDQLDNLAMYYDMIKVLSKSYRKLLKSLGQKANVEIEPDLLTIILDYLANKIPEIVYEICPGAGGYDSICLISTAELHETKIQNEIDYLQQISLDELKKTLNDSDNINIITEDIWMKIKQMAIKLLNIKSTFETFIINY